MPTFREYFQRWILPFILLIAGGVLYAWLVPAESAAVQSQLIGFPDSDAPSHLIRPRLLGVLCFLPAIAGILYACAGTLARYLTRQFLAIFGICFTALLVVWLLLDLQNNLSDLRQGENFFITLTAFYSTRFPAVVMQLLPYALLLSLLYCLGRFSKEREIVAMIQTGRSLPRLCLPLILSGLLCTLLCAGLNYHWAPVADGTSDEILQNARGAVASQARDVLYRNAANHRLWMVGAFPRDYEKGNPLLNVEVTTTLPDGTLSSRLAADEAKWNSVTRDWSFKNAVVGEFSPNTPPLFTTYAEPLVKSGWSETPWQLIKPGLSAPYLGIPDLNGWLLSNQGNELTVNPAPYLTQWHYRWAQPFVCLVTVLLAAPLGIHFSRRGSTGGVTFAVVLSVALMFFTTVSLSLGEATYLSPILAAWLPNGVFALLGLFLFHRRMTGRPIYQSLLRLFPGS